MVALIVVRPGTVLVSEGRADAQALGALSAQELRLVDPYRLAETPAAPSELEREARFAFTALSLCRLALRDGHLPSARASLVLAMRQGDGAPAHVARYLARERPRLFGRLAVAQALADCLAHPPARVAGPKAGDPA